MKYYIDQQVLVVYTELPETSSIFVSQNKGKRYVIQNPKGNKIYLDILERVNDLWIKLRFYENRRDEKTGETKLEIFEAYSIMLLLQKHIKIEGLHDIDLFDGRFNIQTLHPQPFKWTGPGVVISS